jgi:RecA/RadA recombinase
MRAIDYAESKITRLKKELETEEKGRQLEYFSGSDLDDIDDKEVLNDELIERTLQKTGIAMIFGESNSGKTFLAIHLCMCVSTGQEFLGRNVNESAVLYVAAESPAGVKMRARAWQKQHNQKSEKFFVCPEQINLYESKFDADAVVSLSKKIEDLHGVKIGLVVFDTLARISSGANENSNDMGLVMQRCDSIGHLTDALVAVIHHSGKDSLKGARGWSGMRAHIDTEIEVSQSNGISIAEITKQREIEGKGDRFAFKLESVQVGMNQWGNIRSTCWVNPTQLPAKNIRMSPTENAIIELINEVGVGLTRGEICDALKKDKDNVNKSIRVLLNAEVVYEQMRKIFVKHDLREDITN